MKENYKDPDMKGRIELNGMEFHSYHGCLPEERLTGARYIVDFSADYDISAAAASDRLEDTLDSGEVYDIVAAQMAQPSNLLEHVAGRIAAAISEAHPEIAHFSVSVAKENPPVSGFAAWSRVTVEI